MKKRDKKQLLPGIVVAAAISFLVFLYAPVDLYCSNISEFWFDFGILIRASLGLFLISTVVLLLIYRADLYLYSGKFSDQESAAPGWNDDSMGRIYISEDRGFYSLGHRLCCCSAHVYFPEKRSFVQNGNVFKRRIDIDAADHSSQYCIYQWCTAGKSTLSIWCGRTVCDVRRPELRDPSAGYGGFQDDHGAVGRASGIQ